MQILLHLYLCPQNPTHGLCPHGLCPKVEDTTHVSPLRSLDVIIDPLIDRSKNVKDIINTEEAIEL